MNWHVETGDSLEVMRSMPDAAVDAIVTSPPYADQRKYDGGGSRVTERANRNGRRPGTKNQSRKQRSEAPMRYVETFEPFLEQMLRILAPGGSLMLNLGVVMRDGEESPYADEILRRARAMGWKLLHRIVWHKPNANTLSDPRFLRIGHEWVFWLAPTTDVYRGYDKETRTPHHPDSLRRIKGPYLRDRADERYAKRGNARERLHPDGARPTTVFTCGVGGQRGIKHPAPMALKLALHLVSLSCPAEALVLDPFCGSGTTGIACLRRRRRFLGIELEEDYATEARWRIADDSPLIAEAGAGDLVALL